MRKSKYDRTLWCTWGRATKLHKRHCEISKTQDPDWFEGIPLLGFMAKQIHETAGKTLGHCWVLWPSRSTKPPERHWDTAGLYGKADPRNHRKDIGTLLGFMAKQIHETAGKTLGHCWVLWRSRSTILPERHWGQCWVLWRNRSMKLHRF